MARGGSWNDLPAYLRSAFRNAYRAGVRRSVVGFRVARALGSTGPVQKAQSTQRGASSAPPGEEAASPDAELAEETSTPNRDLTPDAGRAPPPTIRKGEVFRDCADCPEMVVVRDGEFLMGSASVEGDRWEDEGPSHRVTIPEPFAVGRYEVMFAEFDACHRDGGCAHAPGDEGWGRGNRPVIHVSWKDAKEYVGWLSETTGREYRLLSESEWEYAARAGPIRRTTGERSPARAMRTAAGAGAIGTARGRRRPGASTRTVSACSTCSGTSGNGWRTAGTATTRERPPTVARGCVAATVAFACCGAARGGPADPGAVGVSPLGVRRHPQRRHRFPGRGDASLNPPTPEVSMPKRKRGWLFPPVPGIGLGELAVGALCAAPSSGQPPGGGARTITSTAGRRTARAAA